MSVYVDDSRIPKYGKRWSHLCADDVAELHDFAASIGLARRQYHADERPAFAHYDVTDAQRARAIAAGAIAETWREAARRTMAQMDETRATSPAQTSGSEGEKRNATLASKRNATLALESTTCDAQTSARPQACREGWDASHACGHRRRIGANPYEHGSVEWVAWRHGYTDAEAKHIKELAGRPRGDRDVRS